MRTALIRHKGEGRLYVGDLDDDGNMITSSCGLSMGEFPHLYNDEGEMIGNDEELKDLGRDTWDDPKDAWKANVITVVRYL